MSLLCDGRVIFECHISRLCCNLQAVLQALLSSTRGVSSAARRFRLRCLKSVILLLDASPDLDFDLGPGEAADAGAMLTPQEKRQQVRALHVLLEKKGLQATLLAVSIC
jgi:hypothetical protein